MPKELEMELKRRSSAKGLTGERKGAYVYGSLRATGWKPSREKNHLQSEVKKRSK